jgi:hypothetical protein
MNNHQRPEAAPLQLPATGDEGSFSIIKEMWLFVRTTGKWWLVPVLVTLLLLGVLALLSGTAYAPFIYTLF